MQNLSEPSDLKTRLISLIAKYTDLRLNEGAKLRKSLTTLLPGFLAVRKQWAISQSETADGFNLLEVLKIDGDEARHSMILAWLVDPRIEFGTHAQGTLGFRLFLEEFATDFHIDHDNCIEKYVEADYWVRREVSGNESRVDIEIAAFGKFLIHIENKLYSKEGTNQTDREWRDLLGRAKTLQVPESKCHAIFLTLGRTMAQNKWFTAVAWNRIAVIFDRFSELAKPTEVKLFVQHVAKAVRRISIAESEESDGCDADIQ